MLLEEYDWKEYHPNGQLWITGRIGLVADLWKDQYDFRTGFKGYEGKPMCRLGLWSKYYDNGQIAWTLDYGNGMHGSGTQSFHNYRKDGTIIQYL